MPMTRLPRRGNAFTRACGRVVLRLLGWRTEGTLPDVPRLVVIAAPHSSNWDFVVGIAFVIALGVRVSFIGKAELFRGPLGWLLGWMGGLPVDRTHPEGVVDRLAARFHSEPALVLAIAPEGTRKPGAEWKTGFYRIAVKAGVPIAPGYFDWGRRTVGIAEPFHPTGDLERDLPLIRRIYAGRLRKDEA
jgi:1-acyl-sn-glycerol-3-phosphate acyltransferase